MYLKYVVHIYLSSSSVTLPLGESRMCLLPIATKYILHLYDITWLDWLYLSPWLSLHQKYYPINIHLIFLHWIFHPCKASILLCYILWYMVLPTTSTISLSTNIYSSKITTKGYLSLYLLSPPLHCNLRLYNFYILTQVT